MEAAITNHASNPSSGHDPSLARRILQRFDVVVVLACLFNLSLLVYLMMYGAPLADDFCRSLIGWQKALAFANHQYMHWTGRWTSMALEALLFSAFNLYRSVPCILLALFALRYFAVANLLRVTLKVKTIHSFALATLLLSTSIALSPGIAEGELWATGAIEYQLPVTLGLIALALMCESRWIVALPFLAASVTMNEFAALAVTGACANLLWLQWRSKKPVRSLLLVTLFVACLACVTLLAPGSRGRAHSDEYKTENTAYVRTNTVALASAVARWTTASETVGLLLFFAGRRRTTSWSEPKGQYLWGWCCVLGSLLALAAVVPYSEIPGRVWDLLAFLYLLLLVYFVIWMAQYLDFGRTTRAAGLLILFLGLLTSPTFSDMVHSVRHAPAWRNALEERAKTHRFEKVDWPRAYSHSDITADPSDWVNKCFARYLHVESISCPTCTP